MKQKRHLETLVTEESSFAETYVNVVFATDREYLPITNVALASVAANYKDERKLRVFVLVDEPLPEEDAKRFQQLSDQHGFVFHAVAISASDFTSVRTSRGISIATYFRLYMHLALPSDVDKVVYLDSDMIILGNIAQIFDTDLGNNLFAGAEDYNSVAHRRAYDTPDGSVNINAGVLICNLKGMRDMDFLGIVQGFQ
jgi:capsular polysaccharide export protein